MWDMVGSVLISIIVRKSWNTTLPSEDSSLLVRDKEPVGSVSPWGGAISRVGKDVSGRTQVHHHYVEGGRRELITFDGTENTTCASDPLACS